MCIRDRSCADEVLEFLAAEVPVGEHLADQLLLPLALGKGGRFLTTRPSLHTLTQVDTLRAFVPVEMCIRDRKCSPMARHPAANHDQTERRYAVRAAERLALPSKGRLSK